MCKKNCKMSGKKIKILGFGFSKKSNKTKTKRVEQDHTTFVSGTDFVSRHNRFL